jgi:hypothetical protein
MLNVDHGAPDVIHIPTLVNSALHVEKSTRRVSMQMEKACEPTRLKWHPQPHRSGVRGNDLRTTDPVMGAH